MKGSILLLLMMLPGAVFGMEVRRVTFESAKLYNYRHSYFPDYTLMRRTETPYGQEETWDYHLGLGLEVDLISTSEGTLYIDQKIDAESTTKQFRRTAWTIETGINFGPATIYRNHVSEHLLDASSSSGYPVMDSYGIRLCFAGSGCGR